MLTLRSGKSQSQGLVVLYYNYKIRDVKESQYAKFVCTMCSVLIYHNFHFYNVNSVQILEKRHIQKQTSASVEQERIFEKCIAILV